MKPNYNKKVTAVNYVIGHRHGNGYFDFKGTRRINELLVNGYVIRFIPNYQPLNYSFPPKISDFKSINWNPKNMEQARVFSFNFADLVFFESDQKEGKNFTFDSGMDNNDVTTGLIHCINSQEFKQLTPLRSGCPAAQF